MSAYCPYICDSDKFAQRHLICTTQGDTVSPDIIELSEKDANLTQRSRLSSTPRWRICDPQPRDDVVALIENGPPS